MFFTILVNLQLTILNISDPFPILPLVKDSMFRYGFPKMMSKKVLKERKRQRKGKQ